MKDKFKDIPGADGAYSISPWGEVRNNKTGRILKPIKDARGYYRVYIPQGDTKKFCAIHRMVAQLYVENPEPEKFKDVCFIDHDSSHFFSSNLQWCSRNKQVDYQERYIQVGKRVQEVGAVAKSVMCVETGVVYKSLVEASIFAGVGSTQVGNACRDEWRTAGGFHWKFTEK